MGHVITKGRIVEAWLAAIDYLEHHDGRYRNLILEVDTADNVTPQDLKVIAEVNKALGNHGRTSVLTVAGTIFPQALYKRVGASELAEHFLRIMSTAKKRGTWGTYAMRLMRRPGREPNSVINPLEMLIGKLSRAASPEGKAVVSNYELGVMDAGDVEDDLALCDVPLYSPEHDAAMMRNQPCLMHLSFKLVSKGEVELTAIYRSHYYAERALGNLIGLRQLMNYVAEQSGVRAGRLACISTDANLDLFSWGNAKQRTAALQAVRAAATAADPAVSASAAVRAATAAPPLVVRRRAPTHTGA